MVEKRKKKLYEESDDKVDNEWDSSNLSKLGKQQ